MADPRRAALCASLFTTATAAVFFLTGVVTLRLPLYLPLSHRWVLGTVASEPELSMDYFGRSLLALSAGGLATLLCLLSTRARPAALPPTTKALRLGLAYAITAFVLCTSLFAYKLYGREPAPSELPSQPSEPTARRSEPTADAPQPSSR